MKSGLYKITNIINQKFYIGSSIDISRRWRQHKRELNKKIHINPKLQNAWNKYGAKNFVFEVLEKCSNILEKEEILLSKLKPHYNVCFSVFDFTGSKNPNWRGGTTFCECGNRISSVSLTCANCQDKRGIKNPFFGRKHKPESILKMSIGNKGKLPANIRKISIDNKTFNSVSEAARQLGVCPATILFRIKSKHWNYKYI